MQTQTFDEMRAMAAKRKQELEIQINALLAQITPLLDENKQLEAFLQKGQLGPTANTRYNWIEMSLECIKRSDELLQTNEILDSSLGNEFRDADDKKKKKMSVALSIALNNMCESGILRKVVVKGYKGHFYGLPQWFGEKALYGEYAVKLQAKTKRHDYAPVILEREFELVED